MNVMNPSWRSRLGAMLNPAQPHGGADEDAVGDETMRPEPVLIVDDDEDFGSECAFSLRLMGYDPIVATSAEEAMALFESNEISIAIVDYNMPGQDGIALIHALGQNAEARGLRLQFIMATGYASKDVAIDAMRASAVDFLEKPINQSDLRQALQRIKGLRQTPDARESLLGKMSSLSTELQRLAMLMDDPGAQPQIRAGDLVREPEPVVRVPLSEIPAIPEAGQLTDFIRELLRKEMKRREIGGGELFGDPAWEMLLDLLLAKIEGRRVSVSSACIASGAPMSTALRLVRRLVGESVLCRLPDEHDRRRHFLIINPKFEGPLLEYLTEQLRQRAKSGVK
ncbi:response regulator receiver domain-containing protein [Novosphingobium sp. PhB57]|uniref:response regulator n=1 Tax=Novosphingobium sp. PhB57 TaxID=2485107 RepID=UPI0010D388F4|nr:response regulator [Novosphingobium sp. PhB57]TCU57550.1 response regulator receiver domain-containing protein [Novosphingobium sp. PhB57]